MTSRWVWLALVLAGMSNSGCKPVEDDDESKYVAGGPVGMGVPNTGGMAMGSGGDVASGSGGAGPTGSGGSGEAGMGAVGTGSGGTAAGGSGMGAGSGGMAAGSGGMAAGSGGMAAGSGGAGATNNEPCPDVNIADFMIMLPGCCTDMGQCGIDGSSVGGGGCTSLEEAAAMAATMGAPAGTIPDPRPCPM